MPLTPERRSALADALPLLAGHAPPAERARLLAVAVHAVTGAGAEVVLLREDGDVQAVAGSDDGCSRLAELEPAFAVLCARTAAPAEIDLTSTDDVPGAAGWRRAAADLGWGRAAALPIRTRQAESPAGALVRFTPPGVRASGVDLDTAATMAAVTAAGLTQQRALERERRTAEQFAAALESRVFIEQAKGVLAERGGLNPDVAFSRLRGYARAHRRRVHEVARDVVHGTAADDVLSHVGRAKDVAGHRAHASVAAVPEGTPER